MHRAVQPNPSKFEGSQPLRKASQVAEWDIHHAFFTPSPVAQQLCQSIAPHIGHYTGGREQRIADLGTAAGSLGAATRQTWPNALQLGIEVRAGERTHMQRHYDDVVIGRVQEQRARLRAFGPTFLISNPPFGSPQERRESQALVFLLVALELACAAALFVRTTFGEDERTWDVMNTYPPTLELAIGGRSNLREKGSLSAAGRPQHGDFCGHKWLVWLPNAPRRAWTPKISLPRLPPAMLSWIERPGTEPSLAPPLPSHLVADDIIADALDAGRGGG